MGKRKERKRGGEGGASLGLEIHLSSFIPSHLTLSTFDPSILIVGSIFFLPFNPGLYLVTAMSPASKSKSKDKKSSKDSQKASARPSGPANAASGAPASAYNPLLGTFHTIETAPSSSASPLQSNGRFRNIDDTDEHLGGSLGAGIEFDSISNNGSWSGESEEHKEKTSNLPVRPEIIPGADNDKREKIRQKNERKHQRQKERRAQELHERCNGYLMSRKLEALAQQLVPDDLLEEAKAAARVALEEMDAD
ncbi:hypothetical protein ES319_D05G074100v1 [Gossypium barbadense]|uniref:Uncharacterized protein n=1 Tax=Gossypium barbadense TaxID=3634 RepID=A0A5J5R9M6_GOSBA|nr:hypothetical protein ES319_D05G074100v1 [Gossypium barbadense]